MRRYPSAAKAPAYSQKHRAKVRASRPVDAQSVTERASIADVSRFLNRVRRSEGCWLWAGAVNASGYGKFTIGITTVLAHRFAFMLANDRLDPSKMVRHRCDNPPCCNPAHLVQGTALENASDKVERGRTHDQRGERNPIAKLSVAQAAEIRQRAMAGENQRIIAAEFGITQSNVSYIKRGATWR